MEWVFASVVVWDSADDGKGRRCNLYRELTVLSWVGNLLLMLGSGGDPKQQVVEMDCQGVRREREACIRIVWGSVGANKLPNSGRQVR